MELRKKSEMKKQFRLFAMSAVALMLVVPAVGVERHVPSEYSTIQAAINVSSNGDIITVAAGTHKGSGNRDIDFGGLAITVRSEDGPDSCIIDCEYQGRGFYFHNDETRDSIVKGFTITRGSADVGGGFFLRTRQQSNY